LLPGGPVLPVGPRAAEPVAPSSETTTAPRTVSGTPATREYTPTNPGTKVADRAATVSPPINNTGIWTADDSGDIGAAIPSPTAGTTEPTPIAVICNVSPGRGGLFGPLTESIPTSLDTSLTRTGALVPCCVSTTRSANAPEIPYGTCKLMREGETDNSGTAVFPSTTRVALPGSWVGYGGAVAFTDVVERLIPKMVSNSPGAATGVKVLRKFAEFTMPYGVTTGGSGWPCAAVTGERRINSNKTGAKFGAIFIMVTSKRPPSAAIRKRQTCAALFSKTPHVITDCNSRK
jgi:hypothetical protein